MPFEMNVYSYTYTIYNKRTYITIVLLFGERLYVYNDSEWVRIGSDSDEYREKKE